MKGLWLLLLLLMLWSCRQGNLKYGDGRPYRVGILAFGRLSESHQALVRQACGHLGNTDIPVTIAQLPGLKENPDFYYRPRQRYRADKLLNALAGRYSELKTAYDYLLLVTDEPVSTSVHGVKDYGICGLSRLGGNFSVVSSWHLPDDLFVQTIRHEWGHAVPGIAHCRHPRCIMNDADGKAAHLKGHTRFEAECAERADGYFRYFFTGSRHLK